MPYYKPTLWNTTQSICWIVLAASIVLVIVWTIIWAVLALGVTAQELTRLTQ